MSVARRIVRGRLSNSNAVSAGRALPLSEALEGRTLLSSVVVNTTLDQIDPAGSKTVSLRDAVNVANTSATPTTITFDPKVFATPKTIAVQNTEIDLTNSSEPTTFTGPAAALTIDGLNTHSSGNNFRIGSNVTASFAHLTVTRGAFDSSGTLHLDQIIVSGELFQAGGFGGGIANEGGILTVTNSTVTGNVVSAGVGGGIWNSGTATLSDVTVSNNIAAANGGGIFNSGMLTITRGTISGNKTTQNDDGGGLYNSGSATLIDVTIVNSPRGGGIDNTGATTLRNATVSGNTAQLNGGGIAVTGGTVTLANTIIAGNSAGSSGPDVFGAVKSLGHNLIGKSDGSTGWLSSDFLGTAAKPLNAKLGPLANNGGPTLTMLPQAGSPAIDKGSNALISLGLSTDQRGLPRNFGTSVDVGAVEVQPLIQLIAPPKQSATFNASTSVNLGSFVQFTNAGPFKLDINWGDGSPDTILTLAAAGTIPGTTHKFIKVGSLTVSEIITDSKGNKSNTATYTEVVTGSPASIAGKVFDDANGDGKIDNGEFGVGLWTVYLDLNRDGRLDAGDKSVLTDIGGNWLFTGLAAGTYIVRVVPVAGIGATKPVGGVATITVAAGQASAGNLFGEKAS